MLWIKPSRRLVQKEIGTTTKTKEKMKERGGEKREGEGRGENWEEGGKRGRKSCQTPLSKETALSASFQDLRMGTSRALCVSSRTDMSTLHIPGKQYKSRAHCCWVNAASSVSLAFY